MGSIWQASDWDRPLSPKRRSSHRRHQPVWQKEPALAGLPSPRPADGCKPTTQHRSQSARPVYRVHPAGSHVPSGPKPEGQQSQNSPQQGEKAQETLSIAVHYVGLAQGELGVLTKRQAVNNRPATAPAGRTAIYEPYKPLYTLQDHPQQPVSPAAAPQDIRHVVDNPAGRTHVTHNMFTSKALQPTTPPASIPRNTRWMRAPPADAPLARKDLPTHSRPRLLSAGGFSGWKLSRTVHSPANVAKPNIPAALRSSGSRPSSRPSSSPASPSSPHLQQGAQRYPPTIEEEAFPPAPDGQEHGGDDDVDYENDAEQQ